MFYNGKPLQKDTLPARLDVDMSVAMETFVSQLRLLLGIHAGVTDPQLQVETPDATAMTEWELRRWLRARTVENVATARLTLVSLSELLNKISNIVIRDEIGQEVRNYTRCVT